MITKSSMGSAYDLIKARRVYKSLPYLLQTIGDIYAYKVGYDNMLTRTGQTKSSLNIAMHAFFLSRVGIVSLAERAIHDFFFTIRDCVGYVARVKVREFVRSGTRSEATKR